jgi:hypothetical protein
MHTNQKKHPIKTVQLPVCSRDRKRVRVGDVPSRRGVILVRHKIVVYARIDQLPPKCLPVAKLDDFPILVKVMFAVLLWR